VDEAENKKGMVAYFCCLGSQLKVICEGQNNNASGWKGTFILLDGLTFLTRMLRASKQSCKLFGSALCERCTKKRKEAQRNIIYER
jgi:hypothetical protein